MENASKELQDFVWDRVLQFAIDADPRPYKFAKDSVVKFAIDADSCPLTFAEDGVAFWELNSAYENISMVSKTFRVRCSFNCPIYLFFAELAFTLAAIPSLHLPCRELGKRYIFTEIRSRPEARPFQRTSTPNHKVLASFVGLTAK